MTAMRIPTCQNSAFLQQRNTHSAVRAPSTELFLSTIVLCSFAVYRFLVVDEGNG